MTDSADTTLSIEGTLNKHCKLTISVASDNDYKLKCDGSNQYYVAYSLVGFTDETNKKFSYETTADTKQISETLTAKMSADDRQDTVSGDYTDTLVFTFDCTLKPYAVIRYESMASTQDVASNSGFGHTSVWEANPEEVELTADSETFKNKYTSELENWREESQTVTTVSGQQKYEVDFHRKMYAFDLNVAYWDKKQNKYVQAATTDAEGSMGATVLKNWGKATIEVNGTYRYDHGIGDYYTAHPKGSSYTFTLLSQGKGYTILGYRADVKYINLPTNKDDVIPFDTVIGGTLTASGLENTTLNKDTQVYYTYYLWILVELDDTITTSGDSDNIVTDGDTVTLLPEVDKTKPVVIEMPTVDPDDAADTKADTKKDTVADTTETSTKADTKADDTTTTETSTKTDTKASETTADAADEKTTTKAADTDTTPIDLMIWDADTMPALVVDDYDANELAVAW